MVMTTLVSASSPRNSPAPPAASSSSLTKAPPQPWPIEWARVDDAALRIEAILGGYAAPTSAVVDDPCGLAFTRSEWIQPCASLPAPNTNMANAFSPRASAFLLLGRSGAADRHGTDDGGDGGAMLMELTPVPHTVVVVRCAPRCSTTATTTVDAERGGTERGVAAPSHRENRSQRMWRLCRADRKTPGAENERDDAAACCSCCGHRREGGGRAGKSSPWQWWWAPRATESGGRAAGLSESRRAASCCSTQRPRVADTPLYLC